MNDQTPIHELEPLDRRAERLVDPSRGSAWVVGVILIILGGMVLVNNTGMFNIPLRNWWALFILIPAVGAFDRALQISRIAGNRLTAPARGSLLVGTVLTFITIMFLFDISWTFCGPILIILIGIAILLNYTLGSIG